MSFNLPYTIFKNMTSYLNIIEIIRFFFKFSLLQFIYICKFSGNLFWGLYFFLVFLKKDNIFIFSFIFSHFFIVVQVSCLHFPPTTLPNPSHPHFPPLILPPLWFCPHVLYTWSAIGIIITTVVKSKYHQKKVIFWTLFILHL